MPMSRPPRSPKPASPVGRAEASAAVPQAYDLFVGSQNVIGLSEQNFDNFIAPKELAMVMFYDPSNPNSLQPKEHFKKAAETAGPENRHFAAVDCKVQPSFCSSLDVSIIPTFKIYSLGKVLSTIKDVSRLDDKQIRKYMDTVWDMHQPKKGVSPKISVAQESRCSLAKRLGFKK